MAENFTLFGGSFSSNRETSQWFDERESQHQHAVSNKDATNGIAQHVYETSHIINWEKVELIDSHKYQRNRKIKGAIYISMLLLLEMAILDA